MEENNIIDKLFVYGTLGPGRPNEHVLTAIGGRFESAAVTGKLRSQGWGAEMGYPGLTLDEQGIDIDGFVFTSENLGDHWASLDAFEGEGYQRVVTNARLESGRHVRVYVYQLSAVTK